MIEQLKRMLREARSLNAEAIRATGIHQLAQLTAHLSACQRVLNEISTEDANDEGGSAKWRPNCSVRGQSGYDRIFAIEAIVKQKSDWGCSIHCEGVEYPAS